MKLTFHANRLKFLTLGAGGLGLILRILLYATAIDGRGLLVADHWANISLWIVTSVTAAAIFFFTRLIKNPAAPDSASPVSFPAAMGAFAAMLGIAITVGREFAEFSSRLNLIVWVLGLCSVLALGRIGLCRLTGTKTHPLLHAILCIYFALRMVSRYQLWSADPQLQDYCFYLTAYVALMLAAYQHAAFDADIGSHKQLWLFSLAGVYLCMLSLKGNMDTLLLLGCGVWAFTNLTSLTPCEPRA